MSGRTLDIAVAGHTNTGKTSLMRTVLRDASFGEVDDRPGVTRQVEAASIVLSGGARIRFFDTPGLEDAVALLDHLDLAAPCDGGGAGGAAGAAGGPSGGPSGGAVRRDVAHGQLLELLRDPARVPPRFRQEAAALAQVAAGDLALYVVDARERVLARHRDELELLSRCARPVVPVLNFAAGASARTQEWREHLARSGLHAVAVFDTVVFDPDDERRLFDMIRVLLAPEPAALLTELEQVRAAQRTQLLGACSRVVADLLVDAAAAVRTAPARDEAAMTAAALALRSAVRRREQASVDRILALCGFSAHDVLPDELPLEEGRWPIDLFSPEALRAYGVRSAGFVATGAAIGLSLDIVMHGLSLGAGTALGAAMGGLVGAARLYGRRLVDRARGFAEIRVNEATLELLVVRQALLVDALMRRGHAAIHPIELRRLAEPSPSPAMAAGPEAPGASKPPPALRELSRHPAVMKLLRRARAWPHWSAITSDMGVDEGPAAGMAGGVGLAADPGVSHGDGDGDGGGDEDRMRVVTDLAARIATALGSRYTPPRSGD